MGAPTASFEVEMVTRPCETVTSLLLPLMPEIATVAGPSTECILIVAHVAASGVHVCAAACSGVSEGGLFVLEMQRGSISPIRIGSPLELTWRDSELSAKLISMRHVRADDSASRQRKVGAMMSGGKIESDSG